MKKILMALAVVLMIIGCTKENDTPASQEEYTTVDLRFTPYQVSPMKTVTPVASVCSRLDIYIIEQGTTDTLRMHQERTATAGFGTAQAVLKTNRTYRLLAVAHNSTDTCTLTGGIVSFADNTIKQTMVADTVFSPADGLSLAVTMQRVVGMFKMRVADPDSEFEGFDHMQFTISESGRKWNLPTMTSTDRAVRTVTISGHSRGQDGYVTYNVFVMADNMTEVKYVDITADSYLTDGTVKESRQFAQVPIQNGYITTYSGTFYITFGMDFSFGVGDWGDGGSYTF